MRSATTSSEGPTPDATAMPPMAGLGPARPVRSHRRWSFAALVIGVAASASWAGTTTWIDPSGGAWTDPTNWSNGVPGPADIAVLPGFAGTTTYAITLSGPQSVGTIQAGGQLSTIKIAGEGSLVVASGCYVGVAGPGTLRVEGPSMTVNGPLVVGSTFGIATLTVGGGSTLTAFSLAVNGNPGNAANLRLDGEGTTLFAAGGITAGTIGPGQLDVVEGATLAGSTLTLGPQAGTLLTLTEGVTAPIQLFGTLKRGGVLAVTLDPAFEPVANIQIPLIATPQPMTSGWQTTLLPLVYDESATLVSTVLGEYLEIPDPAIDLVIEPNPIEVFVGTTVEFDVYRRRLSGILELLCCDGDGDQSVILTVPWPGADRIDVDSVPPYALVGLEEGEAVLNARLVLPGPDLTGSASVIVTELDILPNERVTLSALGDQLTVDTPSLSPQLAINTLRSTADGRFVLFASCAPEILPAGSNIGPCQLYLKDRVTGTVEVVSVGPNALFAGSASSVAQFFGADLSADGRFVVFSTTATNWTDPPSSLAAQGQIWLRDRLLGQTTLVTNMPWSIFWNGQSTSPRITPDGAFVVFETAATDVFPMGLNGTKRDIVRWSRVDDIIEVASSRENFPVLNETSTHPAISADGRMIVFATAAPNAFPPEFDPFPLRPRIFRKDMLTGELAVVSVAADGTIANDRCDRPVIDGSGQIVAFDSIATNLGPIDPSLAASGRVWLRDLAGGHTELIDVSPATAGSEGRSGTASAPVLSADGRFVALSALASNNPSVPLVNTGAFRFDRATGEVIRFARSFQGEALDGCYGGVSMTPDGRTLFFATAEAIAVPLDTNAKVDIFATQLPGTPGDLNGDGRVGPEDLGILLGAWGATGAGGAADLDDDGVVGPSDLAILLGAWTP